MTMSVCERQRGDNTCPHHPRNKISFKCDGCEILVCKECVASREHKGHTFTDLKEAFKKSKENLQTHVWKLENKLLCKLSEAIQSTDQEILKKDQTNKTEIQTVKELKLKCLDDISATFDAYIQLIENHAVKTQTSLSGHSAQLHASHKDVQKHIGLYKSVLKKGTDIEIHDDEQTAERKPLFTIPTTENPLTTSEYKPYVQIPKAQQLVQNSVQVLSELKLSHRKETTASDAGMSMALKSDGQLYKQSAYSTKQFKLLSTFDFKDRFSPCCVGTDQAWIRQFVSNERTEVHLISNKGKVKQNTKVDGYVVSLGIHPCSGQIYGGFKDHTVCTIDAKNGQTRKICENTKCIPESLTITTDDHVIIGMGSSWGDSVYKYSVAGELIHTSQNEYDIHDIAEFPLNNHVAVACIEAGLVLLTECLAEIFRYLPRKGSQAKTVQKSKTLGRNEFKACTVVFNEHGNVLVGECNTNTIHVVKGDNGDCLQVFNIDGLSSPVKLCLYKSVLWVVGESPSKMMCIQLQ